MSWNIFTYIANRFRILLKSSDFTFDWKIQIYNVNIYHAEFLNYHYVKSIFYQFNIILIFNLFIQLFLAKILFFKLKIRIIFLIIIKLILF